MNCYDLQMSGSSYPNKSEIVLTIDGFKQGGIQEAYKVLISEYVKSFDHVYLVVIESTAVDLQFDANGRLEIIKLDSKRFLDFRGFLHFRKELLRIHPNIIISSIFRSQIWAALAKPKRSKLIWMEHNTYVSRPRWQWKVMKLLLFKVDKIVGVSEEVKNFTESNLCKSAVAIPNARTLIKKDVNSRKREFDFIFVGRMVEQKNPILMLESFAEYIKRYSSKSELHFVGDGGLLPQLLSKTTELELTGNCFFHGAIPISSVHEWMRKTKTLVSTSTIEGMGLVRLEALASGCCVVSTNTGGTSLFESVREIGFFVTQNEPKKIADAMKASLEPKYWTPEMIKQRELSVKDFDSADISKRLIEFDEK